MNKKFKKIINGFSGMKVLVIGDLILDEFLWGEVSRISPEAPVPVVWVRSESYMPGGAANVANNINALGGRAYLAGVVGTGERGRVLTHALEEKGIDVSGIIIDEGRPTTLKTRVIAHHQQVVRIDKERIDGLNKGSIERIIGYTGNIIDEVDAIVIEDYGKGVITQGLLKQILGMARRYKKIVTVDPKEEHFSYYKGVTAITPNHYEAAAISRLRLRDDKALDKIGKGLLNKLRCEAVLITLGENGMQLFERHGRSTHIPTVAQDVFDVSGAGDTVISAFTLALASGAAMLDAAMISNYAAGIVVGKMGIAVVRQKELLSRVV